VNQVADRAYKGKAYRIVQRIASSAGETTAEGIEPPVCAIHEIPMVLVHGRKGDFWSCHEKMEDGKTWCSYRPD
jgi:hypothetical protein